MTVSFAADLFGYDELRHITNSNSGKPIMNTISTPAYTVDEGCGVAGIGRTAFYKAISTGSVTTEQ